MTDYISRADAIDAFWEDSDIRTAEVRATLKALPSADAVQGFRGGKIPPKEMLDGTVLIPKHQWLEMERELAELKQKFESADAVQGEWIWRTDIPIGDGRTSAGYICSNCGKDYWHGNVFKYCPSCGAIMKGGAE